MDHETQAMGQLLMPPLKDKHHYWFRVLLLSRGILLLISSLIANINPAVSLDLSSAYCGYTSMLYELASLQKEGCVAP